MKRVAVSQEETKARSTVVELNVQRFEKTYAEFLSDEGFIEFPHFLRQHLYNSAQSEARGKALGRIRNILMISRTELSSRIQALIELDQITKDLDIDTARVLRTPAFRKDLLDGRLTPHHLQSAMRIVGRFEDRRKQITLMAESLSFFFSLSKMPSVRFILGYAKRVAIFIEDLDLAVALDSGYEISNKISDIQPFVDAFVLGEKKFVAELESGSDSSETLVPGFSGIPGALIAIQ